MPFDLSTYALLVVLGGVVAIDGTSFGQLMVSRPFVAASLAGWIVGSPLEGAVIGIVLEAFHLAVLPVGAARYPEGGPAAVVGGSVYAASSPASSTLLLLVLIVLVFEWVGGESVRAIRLANVRLIHGGGRTALEPVELERRHLSAIGLDFVRGMLLVAAGIGIAAPGLAFLGGLWSIGERVPQLVLIAVVAGLLSAAARVVGPRRWLLAAGALTGAVFIALTA